MPGVSGTLCNQSEKELAVPTLGQQPLGRRWRDVANAALRKRGLSRTGGNVGSMWPTPRPGSAGLVGAGATWAAAALRAAVAEPAGTTVAAVSAALVGTAVVATTVVVAVALTLTLIVTARRDVAIGL